MEVGVLVAEHGCKQVRVVCCVGVDGLCSSREELLLCLGPPRKIESEAASPRGLAWSLLAGAVCTESRRKLPTDGWTDGRSGDDVAFDVCV